MITTIVTFQMPSPISLDQARQIFLSTAPKYREVPGLLRKYYVLSEDGSRAGGIYLWQSRKNAEAMYTDEWKAFVREKYGTDASISYLESPVVVDNTTGTILTDQ